MATPRYIQNPSTAASDQLRSELGSYLGQIMNRKKAMDNFALQLRAQDNDFERSLIERDIDRKEKLDSERRADERYFDRLKEQREYSEDQARKRREEAKKDAKKARKLRKQDAQEEQDRYDKLARERAYNATVNAAVAAGVPASKIESDLSKIKDGELQKKTMELSALIKKTVDKNKNKEDLERRQTNLEQKYNELGQTPPKQGDLNQKEYINELARGLVKATADSNQELFDAEVRRRYELEFGSVPEGMSTKEMNEGLRERKVQVDFDSKKQTNDLLRLEAVKRQYKAHKSSVGEIPEGEFNTDNLASLESRVYGAKVASLVKTFDDELTDIGRKLAETELDLQKRLRDSGSAMSQFSTFDIVANPDVQEAIAALADNDDQRAKIFSDLQMGGEAMVASIVGAGKLGTTIFDKQPEKRERLVGIIEAERKRRIDQLQKRDIYEQDREGNTVINVEKLAASVDDAVNGTKFAALYGQINDLQRQFYKVGEAKSTFLRGKNSDDPTNYNSFYLGLGAGAVTGAGGGGSSVPQAPPATPATSRPPAGGKPGGSLPAPNDNPGSNLSPAKPAPTPPEPVEGKDYMLLEDGKTRVPMGIIGQRLTEEDFAKGREYRQQMTGPVEGKDYMLLEDGKTRVPMGIIGQRLTEEDFAKGREYRQQMDGVLSRLSGEPAPYSVASERAQYEEDNLLPAPSVPVAGPAPVPVPPSGFTPSDFTMIDGQLVPKQPAPAQPHPYANVPSVPPPVDQPYYEPLDTTSQGYNLPQFIRAQEKYPHPSEADIDYRIRQMYPGPALPSQSPAPVPQTSVPTPQANPVMGAVQSSAQGMRSELEAMRANDAAIDQVVSDWENKLISTEQMQRRLDQIRRGPAGPSIPIPQP